MKRKEVMVVSLLIVRELGNLMRIILQRPFGSGSKKLVVAVSSLLITSDWEI
jgi:hypothetical protein